MADQWIDPKVYGAQPLDAHPRYAGDSPLGNYQAPAPVPASAAIPGPSILPQAEVELRANNEATASTLEGMGAAFTQWSPVHLWEAYNAPTFATQQGYKAAPALRSVEFPLDQTQEEFLLKSRSPEEFQHKLEKMREQNMAYKAMGDNGIASLAVGLLDPGYLAVDVVSLGAGHLAKVAELGRVASRISAGSVAAAGAYGIGRVEQQIQPMSDAQVFTNAMLNGAATGLLFKDGKMVPKDEGFPGQQLHDIAMGGEGKPLGEAHPDFVGPVQPYSAPDNLTRPAIEPRGEGVQAVQYGATQRAVPNPEYNPALSLSREEQAALNADGRVTQVQTVEDIAQHSKGVESGRTRIDPDAKAVYLPDEDRVFLIQGNIKPHDDVRGILLHEVGVHMNAERVLGTTRFGEVLDRLEELAVQGNKRARQAFEDVPKDTPLHLQREEALGYYIERNHTDLKDGIVQRFVHGTKELLRRIGLKGLKLSENDIAQLVRKSAKGKAGASFDTTFPYVWHGSPKRGIDSLDLAYSGTGEGAAGFGHGHYVTSEKGTALDYRNKEALRRGINPEDGGLYRLRINAEEHQFLDLDAKVQSPTVQGALDRLGIKASTGRAAYDALVERLGSQKAASDALWAEGVAGNKYATGRTRRAETKNSNYVVFHNDGLDTVARYSKGATPMSPAAAKATVAQRVGRKLEWSLSKTMGSFSAKAREVADLLVDNPLEMSGNSVASQQRAIRSDLDHGFRAYEGLLADRLAEEGAGLMQRIISPRKSLAKQRAIEREVGMEMIRRNRLSMDGMPIDHTGVPAHVKAMADALSSTAKVALSEMKRSGVAGAENIAEHEGFFRRRWNPAHIQAIEDGMVAGGMTLDDARNSLRDSLSIGIQRANGWDAELAQDVATSILDRARRKGTFEDSVMRTGVSDAGAQEVRDILRDAGVTGPRADRVIDVLKNETDEAGKHAMLKHRVDVALDEPITMPGGEQKSLADLLDMNLSAITDQYLDNVSAQAAFARKGLTKPSDIAKLRKEFVESIADMNKRKEAVDLFDNTIAALRGDPVGEKLPDFMRKAAAVTQMVGLARAGMFQFTEYSAAMAHYGAARTVAAALKEMPVLRTILNDGKEAEHLSSILAANASADFRIRPFISRLEDNWEIPVSDTVHMSLMQSKQLVPYLNALKFVQGHQTRMVGNLIADTFARAAKGDQKAMMMLEKYGLESHIMQKVQPDIAQHGLDTAKWSDATWDAVRSPLSKMMDDAVIRNRTGEIPAFAQFTSTGKFLFTFRSFVLGAHNKVLAGSLHRDGFAGLGLIMLYQFPLTFAAVSASNAMAGKKAKDDKAALGEAFAQMGSLGLLSEAVGVAFQNKQQFGSPGTIAIDRAYKLGSSLAGVAQGKQGAGGQAAATATSMVPLLSVILPLKSIGENLKDNK